jgi:4-diphosphocytidyl-2-C-methyl-D-erythritol kinase
VTLSRAVRVRCPAKINLGLWILGRRDDGYHEVDTILQTVTLEDELLLEPGPPGFALETTGLVIPGPGPNIIERAWDQISDRAGRSTGIRARLTKRIPVGGGLGGGSSDAAGFLAGADRLLGLGLTPQELSALAMRLGSDVPFFLTGGTARGTGRGERMRHLCPISPCWIVLVSPPFAISTTWAYGRVRNDLTPVESGASILEFAIASRDWEAVANSMYNVFEDVVLPECPSLAELKRAVTAGGALKVLLAGSGSTLFALTRDHDEAIGVARGIAGRGSEVRVVRALERGVTVVPLA